MRVSRRGFLGVTAGVTGATFLSRAALSRTDQQAAAVPLVVRGEKRIASICQQCPGGCGLQVRLVDEQVVGIVGNPTHPVNRGGLCPKAFGALQLLRSPKLLSGPRVRDGQRGHFKEATWDEAIGQVARELSALRQKGLAHTVGILGGQYRGTRDVLWQRFAQSYGTPNYTRFRCMTPEHPSLAQRFMHGATSPWAYDLEQARLVVSFGANILESWLNPAYVARALGRMRSRDGGRLIQIGPRRSLTATKADRWVPNTPGTEGVLALGIAGVLVREGLYDREFVEERCFGFDPWVDTEGHKQQGFKNLVLSDYGLVAVSQTTGVPVDSIIAIARALGETKPALVIGERGAAYGPHDLQTRLAINSLNALIGNLGIQGGLRASGDLPLTRLPAIEPDEGARRSLAQPRLDGAGEGDYLFLKDAPQALAGRLLEGKPYPLNALFLFATNPFANHPTGAALSKAVEKVPLVVSFSPYEDETTERADIVLPDALPMERWQDDYLTHLAGFTCFSVGRPVIAPRRKARNAADTLLAISASLGGEVAKAMPWQSFDQVIRELSKGLHDAHRGYVVASPTEETMRQTLERQGYWVPEFDEFDAFWDALSQRGAWADPSSLPLGRTFTYPTPSKKFELYDVALARARAEAAKAKGPSSALALEPGPADAEAVSAYPLRLCVYRLATQPHGGSRDQPWLQEQPVAQMRGSWKSWIELHPKTAAELSIEDGQTVTVESAKGSLQIPVWVTPGTRPDVVSMPLFNGVGPNPNDLIGNEVDPFRGFGLLGTTRVRVRRA